MRHRTSQLDEYVDDRGNVAETATYPRVVADNHALEVLHEARERLAARLADGVQPGFHHWMLVASDDPDVVVIRSTLHPADPEPS